MSYEIGYGWLQWENRLHDIQGVDRKSRMLDFSYVNNFDFLRTFFIMLWHVLRFSECNVFDVKSPGLGYSSDLPIGHYI